MVTRLFLRYSAIALFVVVLSISLCALSSADDRTLEVGPGKPYADLNEIPWTTLGPGDRVLIYWKDGGYSQKIFVTTEGSAAKPIEILGVIDSQQRRPIITGVEARTISVPRNNQDLSAYRQYYEPLGLILVERYIEKSYIFSTRWYFRSHLIAVFTALVVIRNLTELKEVVFLTYSVR